MRGWTGVLGMGAQRLCCVARTLILGLILVLSGLSSAWACTLPDLKTNDRPDPLAKPTEVTVAIGVIDLLGVDDINQQLGIDFFVTQTWRDDRLIGLEGCRFNISSVWFPHVRLLNSSDLRTAYRNARDEVKVLENGQVSYVQRYTGQVSSYHNLRKFPFDSHIFSIDIGALRENLNEISFIADSENTWISNRLNIEGWDINSVNIAVQPTQLQLAELEQDVIALEIAAKRQPDFYRFRVLLLLTLVVGMSWVIFWVPPSRFEFQIGIGATSMLTAIAFNLAIASQLPPVGYLTTLDKMVNWAILLIFLSIIEALVTGRMVLAGREESALRLDRRCRILFPTAFVCGWAWFVS